MSDNHLQQQTPVATATEGVTANLPWLTRDSITWLDRNLLPGDVLFEIGGGSSTAYFLKKCTFVRTLETSPHWAHALMTRFLATPDLLCKWQLTFVPVDWAPTWRRAHAKGYWHDNPDTLSESKAVLLEKKYLTTATMPSNATVLCIDGGLRSHLFVLYDDLQFYDRFEIVIIDNTEFSFAGRWFRDHPPAGFERFDFVRDPLDRDLPNINKGYHVTTVFVRADRMRKVTTVKTQFPVRWKHKKLARHQMLDESPDSVERDRNFESMIRRELTSYGWLQADTAS